MTSRQDFTEARLRSATLPPSQEELLAAVALDVQALDQVRVALGMA
jgi:tRNA A37 threonylcarbamoyladenosine modification protein TsaB